MKILLSIDNPLSLTNGVVFSTLTLKKSLAQRGHDVRILALSDTSSSHYENGVWYAPALDGGMFYPGMRFLFRPILNLCKEITDWGPDIVHSQTEGLLFFSAEKIAHQVKAPQVHTVHTKYDDYVRYLISPSIGTPLVRRFCRFFFERPRQLIVPSNKTKTFLLNYRIKTPIEVLPTGIDRDIFHKIDDEAALSGLRKSLGIRPDQRILLSAGRLAAEKNIEQLFSYFSRYEDPEAVFLVVGDGPYRKKLEETARDLGEHRILFAGAVPHDRLSLFYSMADVFGCASTSETQGLTYFEALSCGLPLLCRYDSCLDGVLTDGENGYFFSDETEFRDRLSMLLQDGGLRRSMSENALKKAELYSKEAFAENMEQIYSRLLADRRIGCGN